jgi:3-phenylpropionate/trans-cinnamate dioxygenase ferredoxin reductase subunit
MSTAAQGSAEPSRICIVGAGLAGAKAAITLREEGFEGSVVLLGAEPERPYERPPLSKGLLTGDASSDSVYVEDAAFYDDHDIDLRIDTTAVELHVDEGTVLLADGSAVAFDSALIATGAEPRSLRVPGAEGVMVRYLRTLADSQQLHSDFAASPRLVVVGAGWVGLEVAAAARGAGCDVTVLESADTPLGAVLGPQMGQVFADLHSEHGVRLHTGTAVSGLEDGAVHTEGGGVVPADLVLVAVGAAPRTDIAAAAGLAVDDGVLVDASLRSSAPAVFAAGDVARAIHPRYQRHVRVEHWANALNSGPAAARAMLGQNVVYDRLPYFYTDQYDLGMEYVGYADPTQTDVVVRGDVEARTFQAFWLNGSVVDAAMHVNMWDDGVEPLKELVASQRVVDPAALADPSVALADL